MTYVFWGSPRFAAVVLEKLIKTNLPPAAVICSPARPAGRDKILTDPIIKKLAVAAGIPVLQPENPSDIIPDLKKLSPDFFVVTAYAKILPEEIISLSRLGTIGLHPSLLPKYRGASPIQGAILEGISRSGVSIYILDEKMDHGPILAQKDIDIEGLPYPEVEKKLAELGGYLLAENLTPFFNGKLHPSSQDHAAATFTKKLTSEDGRVELSDLKAAISGDVNLSSVIHRKILALNPEPGVFVMIPDRSSTLAEDDDKTHLKRLKLLKSELAPDGHLLITTIQPESGKPTSNFSLNSFI